MSRFRLTSTVVLASLPGLLFAATTTANKTVASTATQAASTEETAKEATTPAKPASTSTAQPTKKVTPAVTTTPANTAAGSSRTTQSTPTVVPRSTTGNIPNRAALPASTSTKTSSPSAAAAAAATSTTQTKPVPALTPANTANTTSRTTQTGSATVPQSTIITVPNRVALPSESTTQATSSGTATRAANAVAQTPIRQSTADVSELSREQKQMTGPRTVKLERFTPPPVPAKSAANVAAPPRTVTPVETLAFNNAVVGDLVKQAKDAETKGDWTSRVALLDKAQLEASRTGERQMAGQLALAQARALQSSLPTVGTGEPSAVSARKAQIQRIESQYRTALQEAPAAEQTLAGNNLAVLYLQEKRPADAVTLLRRMDWNAVDAAQVHLYRYNHGRAEEQNGNTAAALEAYKTAVRQQPTFDPAVDATFRLLIQTQNAADAASVANTLAIAGRPRTAMRQIRETLQKLPDSAHTPALLTALVESFVVARIYPATYEDAERPWLRDIARTSPKLAPLIAELDTAFTTELRVIYSDDGARKTFPAWSGSIAQQRALSQLLKSLGDYHVRPKEDGAIDVWRGLGCYSNSWMLDRTNTEAALCCANLLRDHRETLDADGRLFRELLNVLFVSKGKAYTIQAKTAEDWLNLMRLHMVLASIFEKAGIWAAHDAQSAIFQLEAAIAIEDRLREMDKTFVPSPDLYARLGNAYEKAGRKADAWQQYMKAAEGFAYFKRPVQLKSAMAKAAALAVPLDTAMAARIEDLNKKG